MFSIKEPSRWSGYVILSEETLTDFVRKSFTDCDFADLDDDEKQLNIDRLSAIRQTNQDLIASSDWKSLLPLIENSSQLDWVYLQLYRNFDGDFCWPSDVWDVVNGRYNAIDEEEDDDTAPPMEIKVEINVYSVAFSDGGSDEVSLYIKFFSGAQKKVLIAAIRKELGECYKEKQDEMERLLAIPGGCNSLDETQNGWIKGWLEVEVFPDCASPEIVSDFLSDYDDFTDNDDGWIYFIRRAHIKVRSPLNIKNYPFDANNLHFFLYSNRVTDETVLQPTLNTHDNGYWNGFNVGALVSPRGFKIERLLLSDDGQAPLKLLVLDPGPAMASHWVLQFGFAVTRDPGAVILRTILPGLIIIFTGLVTGLWAWLDPSHSDSVATSVMPGVLIALIALQITAAQSIPQNSGSTRVDKFFLLAYFFVLFMMLALIAPQWIGGLFLAMSLGSVAYGIMVMFKDNWRTAFNSLIGKG